MTGELKQNSAIFSKTWYEDNTTSYAANHEITSNQTCDVAIIGGGLAGLCLLQNLIKEGVDALLLEANEIGMQLTESMAMHPASSVSGFYFAHPDAKYFSVDKIDKDQLEDMASRRSISIKQLQKWLAPNLK